MFFAFQRRYLELARELHPDKNRDTDAVEQFAAIQAAWETIAAQAQVNAALEQSTKIIIEVSVPPTFWATRNHQLILL